MEIDREAWFLDDSHKVKTPKEEKDTYIIDKGVFKLKNVHYMTANIVFGTHTLLITLNKHCEYLHSRIFEHSYCFYC
jgi:hypothetical protein